MDSSNNDSFGSFGVSGGTDGSGSVIASGGDSGAVMPAGISSGSGGISSGGPVVIGGGAPKKGKKWLWAVILGVVFVAVAVGVAVVLMSGRSSGGETEDNKNADFHAVMDENKESIANLVSTVKYVYSGEASVSDFIVGSQEEISLNIDVLNDGISALERLNERLASGPELSGMIVEIDLGENYEGLKNAIINDLEKYRSFVVLTTKLYQISQNLSSAQEIVSEYGTSATTLAEEIQSYYDSRAALISRYSENNCANVEIAACSNITAELLALQENVDANSSAIPQVYIDNIGEINYDEVGSVMYYFDNLYVATKEGNDASRN